jgi:hypothetical protein
MGLDQFFDLVVYVFFCAESQVIENEDLARLHFGDFLDRVRAYHVLYELDLLGAVLG